MTDLEKLIKIAEETMEVLRSKGRDDLAKNIQDELNKATFANAKPRRKKGEPRGTGKNQNRRGLVERVKDALHSLKEGKNGNAQYAGISTVGKKPRGTTLGAQPNSIYSFGPHWPVAHVLDHKTVALNMNTYGGNTADMVNAIKKELPTEFPDSKIIHVHHPDYLKASQIMRGGKKAIMTHLEDASQNHPDPEHKKRAKEDLEYLQSMEKSTKEKREAFIGYDDAANTATRLGRMDKYFTRIGLKVAPHMSMEDKPKRLGAKGANAINSTPGEGPTEQQILHEGGHAVTTPVGTNLADHQVNLGRPGDHGTSTKYSKKIGMHPEKVAQMVEAGLSRRSGLTPFRTREGYKSPKSGLGRAHAEAKQILQDLDEGVKRVNPETGVMEEGNSVNARINLRARKIKLAKANHTYKQWKSEVARRAEARKLAKDPAAKEKKKAAMDAAIAAAIASMDKKKPDVAKSEDLEKAYRIDWIKHPGGKHKFKVTTMGYSKRGSGSDCTIGIYTSGGEHCFTDIAKVGGEKHAYIQKWSAKSPEEIDAHTKELDDSLK